MTADTFSNTLGFTIMGTGNDNNTWGAVANSNVFQLFEDAIANFLTSAVTGGTLDFSGTPPPAAASQVRYAALVFTGALGSDQIIQVPNLTKFWWVNNQTSGAHLLKIKTPSGSLSTAIPQNSGWQLVICDGSNNIVVMPFNSKQVQMPDGTVSAPAYSNINEPTSGWYRAGTQDWRLALGGADSLRTTGAGAGAPNILSFQGNAVSTTACAILDNDKGHLNFDPNGTPEMLGYGAGWHITPAVTGRVLVTVTVYFGSGNMFLSARYGTGAAPTLGAAATGTAIGITIDSDFDNSAPDGQVVATFTGVLSLSLATAYWFDVCAGYGQSTIMRAHITAVEI